jgi:hypothetical protein
VATAGTTDHPPPRRQLRGMAAAATDLEGLSEYELLRLANIRRNEEQLRLLGLDVELVTQAAAGKMAPTAATRRRRARPLRIPDGTERRSARNIGRDAPDYAEVADPEHPSGGGAAKQSGGGAGAAAASKRGKAEAGVLPEGSKRRKITHCEEPPPRPANENSCKNQSVDTARLADWHLGRIIAPLGGQVKRAAMEAAAGGSVTFSRMSGIQEWVNCVALFVNVYGEGYKNAFLNAGEEITWFAQPRQWEGTPVVQRMINCAGGEVTDEDGTMIALEPTPVLLFCRNEGEGYVYCGELAYQGHEPARIPIRFVWKLLDYASLQEGSAAFRALVASCNSMFGIDAAGELGAAQ